MRTGRPEPKNDRFGVPSLHSSTRAKRDNSEITHPCEFSKSVWYVCGDTLLYQGVADHVPRPSLEGREQIARIRGALLCAAAIADGTSRIISA
jgi:hypothetical protein